MLSPIKLNSDPDNLISWIVNPEKMPRELRSLLFAYLQLHEVVNLCRLSQHFNQVLNIEPFWQSLAFRYRKKLYETFLPLVEQKVLSWNEIFHYKCLNNLLYNLSTNQQKPVFSVANCADVKVHISNEISILLKGEPDIPLNRLTNDRTHVYGFRSDGRIMVWDLSDPAKTTKIETAYSKKHPLTEKHRLEMLRGICKNLYVQEGYLIVVYNLASNYLIEVIQTDTHESQLVYQEAFIISQPVIYNNKLFVSQFDYRDNTNNYIFIWDLETKSQEIPLYPKTYKHEISSDIIIRKNVVYLIMETGKAYVMDLQHQENIQSIKFKSLPQLCTVVDNVVFAYYFEDQNIYLYNAHSGKKICKIKVLDQSKNLLPNALKTLVMASKGLPVIPRETRISKIRSKTSKIFIR